MGQSISLHKLISSIFDLLYFHVLYIHIFQDLYVIKIKAAIFFKVFMKKSKLRSMIFSITNNLKKIKNLIMPEICKKLEKILKR